VIGILYEIVTGFKPLKVIAIVLETILHVSFLVGLNSYVNISDSFDVHRAVHRNIPYLLA